MVKTHAKLEHKLRSKWREPILVKEAKSDLVFDVKDFLNARQQTVHARRIVVYSIARETPTVSKELRLRAEYYDTTDSLIDEIKDIRRNKRELQVLIERAGLNDEPDHTWEPLAQMHENIL